MSYVDFGDVLLLTHLDSAQLGLTANNGIRVRQVERITSAAAYSHLLLAELVDHITTSHCLVVQWDGHVIDPARWRADFLDYDYIGARWPQFDDGHEVGNGGFSLRSKRLLEACRATEFEAHHPEDLAICRTNRRMLEARGMRFAPRELADTFSAERASDPALSFGYHGVFLMPRVLGAERFWKLYQELDERGSIWVDTWKIARNLRRPSLIVRLLRDRRSDILARKARQ